MEDVSQLALHASQVLLAVQVPKEVTHVATKPPRHKAGPLSYSQLGIVAHLADDETRHQSRGGGYHHSIYRIKFSQHGNLPLP